jgi:polyhydroxyalkanoate synthase
MALIREERRMREQGSDTTVGGAKGKKSGRKSKSKSEKAPAAEAARPAESAVLEAPEVPPSRPEPATNGEATNGSGAHAADRSSERGSSTNGPGPYGLDLGQFSSEQRDLLERLSLNLARAAITAQGAIAEQALRQADRPAALSPDPFHVAPALNQVIGRLAAQPDRLMRAQSDLFTRYLELWQSAAKRAAGESTGPVVHPARGDKRFADPAWEENPVFDVIKQSYLLTSDWLNGLVSEVQDIDPIAKRRVEFFMKMLTDAFSPSNFLISNPVALREILDTQGESLVRGIENFASDLARGRGDLAISQTQFELFEVGRNVATAPGKVVFRNELFELLQFDPTTEKVQKVPLLIFPPWINKFYILDLRPENSMIRWLTAQGFTVFVTSWVNPDAKLATRTFEDYMVDGVYAAIEAVTRQCGVKKVNTVGYCIGGTLLSVCLAHMVGLGDDRIASATFFAAQQDFAEAGDLLLFANEEWLKELEQKMDAEGGVLPGQTMADTFNMLRANDLIWSFFVNNYLMGREPKPFDLLFWNSDQTRMPKTLHLYYLRRFYGENALAKGELDLGGVHLDLSKVKVPVYVQSSKEDHIAPARSVYRGARLFGGPVRFIVAGSGHIAGVINAPAANKYQYWTADGLPATLEEWQAGAVEHPGSWWLDWAEWLKARSGDLVPARDPANGAFEPLGDAPGAYVKIKS